MFPKACAVEKKFLQLAQHLKIDLQTCAQDVCRIERFIDRIDSLGVDRQMDGGCELDIVKQGKRSGRNVHFGDFYSPVTQQAAAIGKATAAFVSTRDPVRLEGLALTLHRLYPSVDIHVRVRSLRQQEKLVSKGITKAATGYIESTLVRGGMLLRDLGVPEVDIEEMVKAFRNDNYALVKEEYGISSLR